MTILHRPRLLALVLLSLCVCLPASADVIFEIQATDLESGGAPELRRILVSGENMKMEMAPGSDERTAMLFRGARQEMVIVNHDERVYYVLDKDAVDAIGGQMASAMKQMEEALANLPQAQREMAEGMMKQRLGQPATQTSSGTATEYVNTGERGTRAGYLCVKYVGKRGTETISEIWVTDWANLAGAGEAAGVFRSLGEFSAKLMRSIQQLGGPMATGLASSGPMDAFGAIGGFPVVTRSFSGGRPVSETSLQSVRNEAIDPAQFEVPPGYTPRTMGPGR